MLWQPSDDFKENSHLQHYFDWMAQNYNLKFQNYHEAWEWSVKNVPDFWESIWKYFEVISHSPYRQVLANDKMPGARWFEGATLNYAEHVFRKADEERPAILFSSEKYDLVEISWPELHSQVASMAAFLKEAGVNKGDRVAAYLPNIPEATIAFLAAAAIQPE